MEALLIVLGGAITTVGGVVAWYLNSRTSRQLQDERVLTDRKAKEDEVIRASRRERVQPIYALLDDVKELMASETLRFTREMVGASVEPYEPPRAELALHAVVSSYGIKDETLTHEISDLVPPLLACEKQDLPKVLAATKARIADIYSRLDTYVARVGD